VQIGLTVIGAVTALAAIAALVLAAAGGGPLAAWLGVAALVVAAVAAFWFLAVYPTLTKAGQYEGRPVDGLPGRPQAGGRRRGAPGSTWTPRSRTRSRWTSAPRWGDRLEAATEAGEPLRAFSGGTSGNAHLATFPWWIAFSTSTAGSMSGTGTVSGGGAAVGAGRPAAPEPRRPRCADQATRSGGDQGLSSEALVSPLTAVREEARRSPRPGPGRRCRAPDRRCG
jgi:hypothetical protein